MKRLKPITIFLLLVPVLLGTACSVNYQYPAVVAERPAFLPERYTVSEIPYFTGLQTAPGAAVLAALIADSGMSTIPSEVAPMLYETTGPTAFQTDVRTSIRAFGMLPYPMAPELMDLIVEIASGNPALVLLENSSSQSGWSYVLAKGFDFDAGTMVVNSDTTEGLAIPLRNFERRWIAGNRQALLAVEPGNLPTTADAANYFAALSALQRIDATNTGLQAAYQRGLEEWPEDRNLLMGYGQYLMQVRQYFQAADVFSEVMNLYPSFGMAHNNMARALIEMGRWDEARFHANQAVATDDEFNQVYTETLETINRRSPTANN